MKYIIKGMQIEELEKLITDNGFSKFRASQIYNWLYKNCVNKIDMMENLSCDLRLFLKENSIINPFLYITKQIRKIYLNSSIYNTKISKVFDGGFEYIPHLKIFDCIVKVKDRRNRIEDYDIESIWKNQNLTKKDFMLS